MLVNLKRNWFAPGARLFRDRDNPVEIPEELQEHVPPDAEEVEEEVVKQPKAKAAKSTAKAE